MNAAMMIGIPGPPELAIIAGIFVLLFGAKKVPELMKGIGQGIREFRQNLGGADDDDKRIGGGR